MTRSYCNKNSFICLIRFSDDIKKVAINAWRETKTGIKRKRETRKTGKTKTLRRRGGDENSERRRHKTSDCRKPRSIWTSSSQARRRVACGGGGDVASVVVVVGIAGRVSRTESGQPGRTAVNNERRTASTGTGGDNIGITVAPCRQEKDTREDDAKKTNDSTNKIPWGSTGGGDGGSRGV